MINVVTYDQIHPLVEYAEIKSEVVHCHFHCPVKSKKIVAITALSLPGAEHSLDESGVMQRIRSSTRKGFKKYFARSKEAKTVENIEVDREKAIVDAFEKVSERFIWSDEHKHFVYKF